jgi:hypothetical protein
MHGFLQAEDQWFNHSSTYESPCFQAGTGRDHLDHGPDCERADAVGCERAATEARTLFPDRG